MGNECLQVSLYLWRNQPSQSLKRAVSYTARHPWEQELDLRCSINTSQPHQGLAMREFSGFVFKCVKKTVKNRRGLKMTFSFTFRFPPCRLQGWVERLGFTTQFRISGYKFVFLVKGGFSAPFPLLQLYYVNINFCSQTCFKDGLHKKLFSQYIGTVVLKYLRALFTLLC